jgi:hypothetical protein
VPAALLPGAIEVADAAERSGHRERSGGDETTSKIHSGGPHDGTRIWLTLLGPNEGNAGGPSDMGARRFPRQRRLLIGTMAGRTELERVRFTLSG